MRCELRLERSDRGIVTLGLASPSRPVVVLDRWLISQIHLAFDEIESQDLPRGFVLMSDSDRVFVAGADLSEIDQLDDPGLHAYLKDAADGFARIAHLPCPTAACINGAALGGGLEIAMHCDVLIGWMPGEGEKPYRVGLPEAGLGLCPGWGGTQMLPARIDPARAIELTARGITPRVDEISELFVECVDDPSQLHAAAESWIASEDPAAYTRTTPRCINPHNAQRVRQGLESIRADLGDTPSARAVIEAVEVGLERGWEAAIARERELLVRLRHTDIAREKLAAFFAGSRS